MKLGLESYSTRNAGLDPVGVLNLAGDLGLAGVLFELSPFTSFADDELARIRATAQQRNLYIEFGMGSIFRWHPMAEKGIRLLDEAGYNIAVNDAQIVIHHLEVAHKLGSPLLRCVGGNLFTRDEGHDMTQLADQAVAILRTACRAAEQMGMKIALENHADFTVRELMTILARVNSPAFGFTLDSANLAFDLDQPERLARIMAAHALTTHFKNYKVIRTPAGLALENCALGEGDMDQVGIAEIIAQHQPAINLNIEIHSQYAPFKLNILQEDYWQSHPAPRGDGLGWYLGKAWAQAIADGEVATLPDGSPAWQVERDHLERSVRWAKQAVGHLLGN